MSAIAGIFGASGAHESVAHAMLRAMPQRGDAGSVATLGDDAVLAVSRFAWERSDDIAGLLGVVRHAGMVVAADATLYYCDDLRARLVRAGATPSGPTAGHLILDAYRVWGTSCASQLEGDFAFVLWDAARRLVMCCRDGIGLRPLYYGVRDGTLVVASSAAGVRAHPAVSDELNVPAIALVVAGQTQSLGAATSFRDVQVLPAGAWLTWRHGRLDGPSAVTAVQPEAGARRLGFKAAAERLRGLLTDAMAQRLPATGRAAVWMSGGWDSTAVFAAGRAAIRRDGRAVELRPVCISYPERDPGREDDLIQAVLDHWQTDAHWLRSQNIPLFDNIAGRAARRDEAPALLYGPWNAALAAGSRAAGARVAFDGNGGDQLFGPATSHHAALLASGRWWAFAREWWVARQVMGTRPFLRQAVTPLLPESFGHFRDRPLAPWIEPGFAKRSGLVEHERSFLPRAGLRVGRHDRDWLLTAPNVGWAMSRIAELALAEGVELRSPLLDHRIIAFAFARPWHERGRRWETKRLLRAAMRDLLPARVLAPRGRRTGVTFGYSRYWMEREYPALFERLFQSPLILAELGIVEPGALRRAAATALQPGAGSWDRVNLFQVLEVEHWLRARASSRNTSVQPAGVPRGRGEAVASRRSQSFHVTAGG